MIETRYTEWEMTIQSNIYLGWLISEREQLCRSKETPQRYLHNNTRFLKNIYNVTSKAILPEK